MIKEQKKETISEIIFSIKDDLAAIRLYQINIDTTNKLILNRLNKLLYQKDNDIKEDYKLQNQSNNASLSSDNDEWAPKPGVKLPPLHRSQLESDNQLVEASVTNNSMIRNRIFNPSLNTNLDKKVSVSQFVSWHDGKPVFLADVKIYQKEHDARGKPTSTLVCSVRTNPKGRWLASLKPGNYLVHLLKKHSDNQLKEPIETTYSIQISSTNSVIELDEMKI